MISQLPETALRSADSSAIFRVAREKAERTNLATKDLVALLRKLERVVSLPQEQPLFLPDTVVGILEISDGTGLRRFYFAADPEQAKTQGKIPPSELLQVVNTIYAMGARLTGSRQVKP